MKIKLFLLSIGLLCIAVAQAQTVFTSGSWEEIRAKAKQENKQIFVDLYFEGCMPCAEMDRKVFPDSTVGALLNINFVNFKTDVFKEDIGARLSMKYAASGFPTYLFLNADGKAIDIVSGFTGVARFVPLLQEVMDRAGKGQWLAYDERLDMDYPDFYRKAYLERKRQVSPDTVGAFLATQSDLSDEVSFVVMNTFRSGDQYNRYYLDQAHELATKYGRMPVRNRLTSLITAEGGRLGKAKDSNAFGQLLSDLQPLFAGDEWRRFSAGFYHAYYQGSQDAQWMLRKLETENDTYLDWQDKSNVLASMIIDVKDQPEVLKEIDRLFAVNVDARPNKNDLYKRALIRLYLHDFEQAAVYAQRALDIDHRAFVLKDEQISALLKAAKEQKTTGFEAVKATEPKPITLD
ncbi:MAG TPA: thioredoxin family protein [Sphingobacterium sp.]|nr:thioredoxin family protein [Sphingobacterium sp.]